MTPVLERAAALFAGQAKVCRLLINESPHTAHQFGVHDNPSMLFFLNGTVVGQLTGARPLEDVSNRIRSILEQGNERSPDPITRTSQGHKPEQPG